MKIVIVKANALLSAAILMLSATSCREPERTDDKTARAVPVEVMVAGESADVSVSNYVGRVEPSRSTIILNRFPGTLESVSVKAGGKVSKGAVIAKLHSETLQSAYDIAKATLDQAEDGYERVMKVYGSGSVTEVKMVEIRTQLEKARAAEKSARKALDDCVVKAPFSGMVDVVYCQEGEHLEAASPIVRIMDLGSVEIHFNVPESEYAGIPLGTEARINVPALDRTTGGSVAVKGISASPLSHAYDFTIKEIDDTEDLMPGMVCKVSILSNGGSGIVIPASAVMTDMKGRYVWGVTEDDTVCKTYVSVSGYSGRGVLVSDGIGSGDRVIVAGSRKVSTGMKVNAVER